MQNFRVRILILHFLRDNDGYDSEVVFSTKLIGDNNGNILPINIDLNSIYLIKKKSYYGINITQVIP